jgi:hypothetical protein
MSSHNTTRLFVTLLPTLFIAIPGFGQVVATPDTADQTRLQATVKGEEIVGDSQIFRVYANCGTNRFAFVMPSGFRLDASGSGRLTLTGFENSCFITVRLLAKPAIGSAGASVDGYRDSLLVRFPGATIRNRGLEYALNRSGPAFDLEWQNTAGTWQCVRAVFISTPAGVLQFDVSAPISRRADAQLSLGIVLSTLSSNENGKLTIVPFSDKS